VSALTAVALLASFGVQVLAASLVGASVDLDTYFIALTIPTVAAGLLTSTIAASLIPVFARLLAAGDHSIAWSTALRTVALAVGALAMLCISGVVLAEPLLAATAPGLSPASRQLGVQLAMVLWPAQTLAACAAIFGGVQQAQRRFVRAAAAPVVANATTLAFTAWLVGTMGVRGLAVAALVGATIQLAVVATRSFPASVCRWSSFAPGGGRVRHVLSLSLPVLVGGVAFQSLVIFDRFLASSLPPGSITYLALAQRIVGVAATVITSGAATVGVVVMSANLATGDSREFRRTISTSLQLLFVLVVPVIAILGALRGPFVISLFLHGRFGAADSGALAATLPFYLFALLGIALGSIIGAAYYALQDTRTVTLTGLVGVVIYFIYQPRLAAAYGAVGIAAGVGIYYTYQFAFIATALWIKLERPSLRPAVARLSRALVAAVAAAMTAMLAVVALPWPVGQLVVGAVLGIGTYLGVLRLVSPREPLLHALGRFAQRPG
jgi:putative peptidoglycan lipid II flippase